MQTITLPANQIEAYMNAAAFLPVANYDSNWIPSNGEVGMRIGFQRDPLPDYQWKTTIILIEKLMVESSPNDAP